MNTLNIKFKRKGRKKVYTKREGRIVIIGVSVYLFFGLLIPRIMFGNSVLRTAVFGMLQSWQISRGELVYGFMTYTIILSAWTVLILERLAPGRWEDRN